MRVRMAVAVPPSERELDAMEQAFLGELVALMQAGHYRLLDAQMWDIAQAEAFMVYPPPWRGEAE